MSDTNLEQFLNKHIIVIYDGVCGFCNSSIQFILQQQPSNKLRFVSFQSEMGNKIRAYLNINEDMDSIVVVEGNQYFKKSKAIFRIFGHIQSNWKYVRHFSFIPSWISDFIYTIIAQNRYGIKKNSCPILTVEERELFV